MANVVSSSNLINFLTDTIEIQNYDCYSWYLKLRAATFTIDKVTVNCKKKSLDWKYLKSNFRVNYKTHNEQTIFEYVQIML